MYNILIKITGSRISNQPRHVNTIRRNGGVLLSKKG